MANSVTFDPAVGGDGSTVTDDSNPTTGLAGGGHRVRFVPALSQVVAVANFVVTKAAEAAASAASALGGLSTTATSGTTANVPAVGASLSLNVGAGKGFVPGMKVAAVDTTAPTTKATYGRVTSYSGSTLTLTADESIGAGSSVSSWQVSNSAYGVSQGRLVSAGGLATGGGSLAADRTITVTAATAADVKTGTSTTAAVTPSALTGSAAHQTLTDAATVAWNVASGYNAEITLGGNRTIGAPTNLQDGIVYTLELVQDGTGSRIPAWNAIWDWGALGAPVLQTAAGKRDMLTAKYVAATGKLYPNFRKGA